MVLGTNEIWQFTPNPAGWVQKNSHLPVPLGYLPTTTIGSLVYTGGGADITGGVLTDTTNAFVYDPVADSINTIATITDATSNTRAVNFCGLMYVLGGNFNAPTNEVQIYDPVSNTWSVGTPFAIPGRNFAADTDGTNNIWKAGGYDSWPGHNRFDGNLQLSGESLCGFVHRRRRRQQAQRQRQQRRQRLRQLQHLAAELPRTAAASHAGASAVRRGFNKIVSYGDSRCSRVPVMRTSPPRRILGVLRAYSVSLKLRRQFARAMIDRGQPIVALHR